MRNISHEACKISKQMSANVRVCLYDLQVLREIFPIFLTKDTVIYILSLLKCLFWAFLMSEKDLICTVTLCHLSQFWRAMVHYNVLKELFPPMKGIFSLGKIPFLFPSKITKNSIRIVL